jgi:hypothetical protein
MLSAKCLRCSIFAAMLLAIAFSNSPAQRKPYPRLSVELGAGYAAFSPDEINSFLAALGRKKIANGISLRGGLRIQASRHVDFNIKLGYLTSVSKADFVVTDENSPDPIAIAKDEYHVRSLPVSVGLGGRIFLSKIRLRGEFNIEHHIARVQYKIPAIAGFNFDNLQTTAKSNGIGFSFAAGPEWRPLALLALNAKMGYRAAKISDFLSTSHASPPLLPVEFTLELSGIFFEAGVQIHP